MILDDKTILFIDVGTDFSNNSVSQLMENISFNKNVC